MSNRLKNHPQAVKEISLHNSSFYFHPCALPFYKINCIKAIYNKDSTCRLQEPKNLAG